MVRVSMPVEPEARLTVQAVSFVNNYFVYADTRGRFEAPEWRAGRPTQFPVCYVRGSRVSLSLTLRVSRAEAGVWTVSGVADVGAVQLRWFGSVTLTAEQTAVSTAVLVSEPLPDVVECYETLHITWAAQSPGGVRQAAGETQNVLYSILSTPFATPYWTLLDFSCREARGATTAAEVVERAIRALQPGRTLVRKRDGTSLRYWQPANTHASDTFMLLASNDGNGQCGAWAHLFLDVLLIHGVQGAKKLLVQPQFPLLGQSPLNPGFMVKTWRFEQPNAHGHYQVGSQCFDQPGIPGQGNEDPPSRFRNHFMVKALNQYYDPSYGAGPFADQAAWENAALDGLLSGDFALQLKQANPGLLLTTFQDAFTGEPL